MSEANAHFVVVIYRINFAECAMRRVTKTMYSMILNEQILSVFFCYSPPPHNKTTNGTISEL